MSVINTMLKDLEQREGQTLSGRYQPPQPSRWRLALIAWLLALWGLASVAGSTGECSGSDRRGCRRQSGCGNSGGKCR